MFAAIALLAIPALSRSNQFECKLKVVPEGAYRTLLLNTQDACNELKQISRDYFQLFEDDPLEHRVEAQAIHVDHLAEEAFHLQQAVAAKEEHVKRSKNRVKLAQQKLLIAKNKLIQKDKVRKAE